MSLLRIVTDDEPLPTPPTTPALVTKYQPDRFQQFAIQAIEKGENVLVTAKTGSGKTFVGEYQIAKSLQRGGRIFYTTPIKSLSNQKYHDLKHMFPDVTVGIMTGDIKFIPNAQIVIMTTEILRNLLFKKGTLTESVGATSLLSMDGLDSVIFDEVHYINDKDRGHVWEETLILLPPSVHLILLSATLSSPQIFANWLANLKQRPLWLISTQWRAVPLEHAVISDGKPLTIYTPKEDFLPDVYRAWLAERKGDLTAKDKFVEKVKNERRAGTEGAISGKVHIKSFDHTLHETLAWLQDHNGLPALAFVFSRAKCESLAARVPHTFLDSSDSAAVAHIWDFHLSRYKSLLEKSPQMHTLRALALRGIAFHHSGLLPFLKEILEILFSKGYVKLLFATETFAVGINMPTKTVIFTSLQKFTDASFRPLLSSEYIQMAGRAGRRGKDDKGLVLYIPDKDPLDVFQVQSMLTGRASSFQSRMQFEYGFLLKALNGSVSVNTMLGDSYWRALEEEEYRVMEKDIAELQRKQDSLRFSEEELSVCSAKGRFEETIANTHNAKKKQAMREYENWKQDHKESVWGSIFEKYRDYLQIDEKKKALRGCLASRGLNPSLIDLPEVVQRFRILEEFQYVDCKDGTYSLTDRGRLSSECNEGHPFLLTEYMLFLNEHLASARSGGADCTIHDVLTTLAVFLGESKETMTRASVEGAVAEHIDFIREKAKKGYELERTHGVMYNGYWELNEEWVEPMQIWLTGEHSLAALAHTFGLFEGAVQKAILKLAAILEELQALATLASNVELLKFLDNGRNMVLQDSILAESLYLRI
jgi:superfamily II RNA helicase